MSDFIKAPWNGEQVDALNLFQRMDHVHPFTCANAHDGLDRSLIATRSGWICPHCDYRQDWAHEGMLHAKGVEVQIKLPCDVMLPPATIIRKGCDMSVLLTAFNARRLIPYDTDRFNDPVPARPEDWVEP